MEIDRSKKPTSLNEISFTPPAVHHFELSNGLKIYFSPKESLPIIKLSFLVNTGGRSDTVNLNGLNNLLSMCIDEGAGKYDSLELADEFEKLGAHFSVSSDADITSISLQVLQENFSEALKLFADVILRPHFKENDFNREKNKVLTRLKQVQTEPDYIADVSFEYFLFGKSSPYSYPILGIEDSVQKIDIEKIKATYETHFSPDNSMLVVVGNVNQASLRSILEAEFKDWQSKGIKSESNMDLRRTKSKLYLINKANSVQTEIRTGFTTSKRSEKDFFHKQVLNLILGGQFSSRLNLNLREKHGYTYGVHSRFNYFKKAGYFAVSTSVATDVTKNALTEIRNELKNIASGVSETELTFAKSSITKRFPANFESYRQIASNICSRIIHKLPENYFETYVDRIESLSLNEVNKIASEAFNSVNLITVLVGDSKKIINQLQDSGFGEISPFEFKDVFN